MTRQEITGNRDLYFSGWVRENLPDSYDGYRVTDIDFFIANVYTKKFMLIETKCRKSKVPEWQRDLFSLIHRCLKNIEDWTYLGFNLITFEGTTFFNGKVYLNNKEITENELKEFLSF